MRTTQTLANSTSARNTSCKLEEEVDIDESMNERKNLVLKMMWFLKIFSDDSKCQHLVRKADCFVVCRIMYISI